MTEFKELRLQYSLNIYKYLYFYEGRRYTFLSGQVATICIVVESNNC
jgi:hypothetical protein